MAIEKIVNLNVTDNVEQTTQRVTSLKTELRKAQQEVAELSDKFGATSKQAIEAAKRAAELKDKIGDAKNLTAAFNPDAKFKALSSSLAGVSAGFAAYQGALGLVGVQNKDLEKQLLKVQSAMALAGGLQAVGESIDSFKQLGAVVKSFTLFQKIATAAHWRWNAAMEANPIGVIVVAITAVIAAGYKLITMFQASEAASDAAAIAYAKVGDEIKKINKEIESTRENLSLNNKYTYDLAKASGESSEALRKMAFSQALATAELEKANTEKLRSLFIAEREKIAFFEATGRSSDEIEAQKKRVENLYKNLEEQKKVYHEANKALKQVRNNNEVEITQEKTDAKKKALDAQKEHNKKLKEEAEAAAKKRKEDLAQEQVDLGRIAEAAYDKMLKDRIDSLDAELTAILEFDQRVLDNEQKKNLALADADLQKANNTNLSFKDRLSAIKEREDLEKNIVFKNADEKTAYEKANADARVEIAKEEAKAKMDALDAVSNTLGMAADLAGRQTGIGKALALAQATISMFTSAQKAYEATVGIPIVGPTLAPINAGLAIAVGLKNIKEIAKVKVPGSGGGASPNVAGGGSGVTAPSFNIVGQNSNNQLAQSIANRQQQPIQAYVVSGNVSSAQSLDRNRIDTATFN